jgi:hypothetical protein
MMLGSVSRRSASRIGSGGCIQTYARSSNCHYCHVSLPSAPRLLSIGNYFSASSGRTARRLSYNSRRRRGDTSFPGMRNARHPGNGGYAFNSVELVAVVRWAVVRWEESDASGRGQKKTGPVQPRGRCQPRGLNRPSQHQKCETRDRGPNDGFG